jgi:formylmethanofuran dehydrogenase subunit A
VLSITYVNIEEIDKLDEEILNKIRNEFDKNFYILFADYLYKNNYINKKDCEEIKDKSKSL